MKCSAFARMLMPLVLGATTLATAAALAAEGKSPAAPGQRSCQLHSHGNKIEHVVYLQFDNVHLRRDNPNVPSDLEQMPHLLNFLQENGTVSNNHFTPLISHTAHDIVTSMTGVYGSRNGWAIANTYGFFKPDGSVGLQSSFLYWTGLSGDGQLQMINEKGKNAPAPWVSWTRAGCDVGAFSIANIEFESIPADVITVFGADSPEAAEANSNRTLATADFEGISLHCAKGSPLCAKGDSKPDLLPDEPGGYEGFSALYGNQKVQPVISPSAPVKDMDGNIIADSHGNPGFPGFDPTATQSLGYVAQMLEAGVPVVYLYISDAHDNELGASLTTEGTFGPGEAPYVQQLATYDEAFGKFFARLENSGITKDNTLFVITADENDQFVGGPPSPANCDGIHVPCTYAKKGEVDLFIDRELLTQRMNTTPFTINFDDAPNFYVNGNPAPTDPVTRKIEQDVNALTVTNPVTNNPDKVSALLADRAEMQILHMIPFAQDRVPTFTMFGNDTYFDETASGTQHSQPCTDTSTACVEFDSGFAWNHGDFQGQITRTWFGMVGPGVLRQGTTDNVFSDETDLRPTIMALAGLTDDYVHDGRVLVEDLDQDVLPPAIKSNSNSYLALARAYKDVNATKGPLGVASLVYANKSINSSDATYAQYLTTITAIASERDQLASRMIALLDGAAFQGTSVRDSDDLIEQANRLVARVQALAGEAQNHITGSDKHDNGSNDKD